MINKVKIIKNAINKLSEPIIIERWEMLYRFIFEMWQHLWSPKEISPLDLYFAFIDWNIWYMMMNKDFNMKYFNKNGKSKSN